jgi:hypothetical protein
MSDPLVSIVLRSYNEGWALGDTLTALPAQDYKLSDAGRDLAFCRRTRRLREWPHALHIRWHQRRARLAGFADGWKTFRARAGTTPSPPVWARPGSNSVNARAAFP